MNPDSYHHEARVYVEDVDYMGIVYHPNYLRYFERARTEILRHQGFSLSGLGEANTLFAITKVNIHYIAPAWLDDLLTITSQMRQCGACSFLFDQEIKNQEGKKLCEAQIKVVSVDKNLKPKRFPQMDI